MRITELLEARSNPEVNRKIASIDELQQYAGQENVFVSFTTDVGEHSHEQAGRGITGKMLTRPGRNYSGAKLGINPTSGFETPVGVYFYPVDYVIQFSKSKGGKRITAPFTGSAEWQFLWVVKIDCPEDQILDCRHYTAKQSVAIEDQMASACKEHGMALPAERAKSTAKRQDQLAIDWNLTRLVAEQIAQSRSRDPVKTAVIASSSAILWNKLLRRCGFLMIRDDGTGTIHSNEPTQTLVLDPRLIKPISLLRNDINPDVITNASSKMNIMGIDERERGKVLSIIYVREGLGVMKVLNQMPPKPKELALNMLLNARYAVDVASYYPAFWLKQDKKAIVDILHRAYFYDDTKTALRPPSDIIADRISPEGKKELLRDFGLDCTNPATFYQTIEKARRAISTLKY